MEESTKSEQTETQQKPSQKNPMMLVIVVVVLILAGVGYFVLSRKYQKPATTTGGTTQRVPGTPGSDVEEMVVEEEGEVREITVEGDQYSFSPSSISLKKGEKIKLTFNNVGSFPHNLTIEGLGIATKTIGGGETDSIEFTAEDGTYTTFCSVGNHRAQGMEGVLEVE